ncbi:MAG: hypothetical protein ABIP51_03755, partial [Bacteroidia bacterium]
VFAYRGSGVYTTNNDGASWVNVSNGLPVASEFFVMDFDYIDGVLYVSIDGSGLYASSDNGTTWTLITGIPGTRIMTIAGHNNDLFVGTYANGVYYSGDKGATWINVNGSNNLSITALTFNGQNIIMNTTNQSVWRKTL